MTEFGDAGSLLALAAQRDDLHAGGQRAVTSPSVLPKNSGLCSAISSISRPADVGTSIFGFRIMNAM